MPYIIEKIEPVTRRIFYYSRGNWGHLNDAGVYKRVSNCRSVINKKKLSYCRVKEIVIALKGSYYELE